MGFLRFLDVGIGFALGMMVLATLVGSFAGVWLTLIRSRARQVQIGLATLVHTLGTVTDQESNSVAEAIISDSMVKTRALRGHLLDPKGWLSWFDNLVHFIRGFAAETIHREELVLLLLRKASQEHPGALKAVALDAAEAREVLARVERTILDQEAANPGLPAQIWRTRALNKHTGDMASKLFAQFDNVMDRIEDNVSFSAKMVAMIFAAVFLSFWPVDALDMISRLSTDDQLRAKMVEQAKNTNDPKLLEAKVKESSLFGNAFDDAATWKPDKVRNPGVLLTWVMVSLGAPFWLGLLNKLLGVRSEVARKATEQRTLRESAEATP